MYLNKMFNKIGKTQKYVLTLFISTSVAFSSIYVYDFFHRNPKDILRVKKKRKPRRKKEVSLSKYLDEAYQQHQSALRRQATAQLFFSTEIINQHLKEAFREITGNLRSAAKFGPVMDRDTFTTLQLFCGSNDSMHNSYCNLRADKAGIKSAIARYLMVEKIALANCDLERIEKDQDIHRLFRTKNKKGVTKLLNDLIQVYQKLADYNTEETILQFVVRDDSTRITTTKHWIAQNKALFDPFASTGGKGLFDTIKDFTGKDFEAWLKKGTVSPRWLMFTNFIIWTFDVFIAVNNIPQEVVENFERRIMKLNKFESTYSRFSDSFLGLIVKGVMSLFKYEKGLVFVNGDENPLNKIYWGVSLIPNALTAIFQRNLYIIDRIRYPYLKMFGKDPSVNKYRRFQLIANKDLALLKQFQRFAVEMKNALDIINRNPELRKRLEPEIKIMENFLYSKKYRRIHSILRKIKKLKDKELTLSETVGDIWKIFGKCKIAKIIGLTNSLDDLSDRDEEAIGRALLAFFSIAFYAREAYSAEQMEARQSKKRLTLAKILVPNEKKISSPPTIEIEGMYSLFIPETKVVKNDYSNPRNTKTGEEQIMILEGDNGGGKSNFQRDISITLVSSLGTGLSHADKIIIDPVRYVLFHGSVIEATGEFSLMERDLTLMDNNLLRTSDSMIHGETAFIAVDEACKGTTPDEGSKVLMSVLSSLFEGNNTSIVASTHLNGLEKDAKKAGYDKLVYYSPEYDTKKGRSTFKITKGRTEDPVCLRAIEKTRFHRATADKVRKLMLSDPEYRFRHKVGKVDEKTFFQKIMESEMLKYALFVLIILLLGIFVGTLLPSKDRRQFSTGKKNKKEA